MDHIDDYKYAYVVKPNWIGNLECGLHSDFPICCILFYLFVWGPKNKYLRALRKFYFNAEHKIAKFRNIHYIKNDPSSGFGRIPCPICLFFFR